MYQNPVSFCKVSQLAGCVLLNHDEAVYPGKRAQKLLFWKRGKGFCARRLLK